MSNNNSQTNIIVYHGSTSLIDKIDVSRGKPYKDFGRGFYVTKSRSHASNLALRNKRIEEMRFERRCEAYIYTYEMSIFKLFGFNVKEFLDADLEWMQFVIANRKVRNRIHDYDVVIGPTANDDTMAMINAYLDELYGEVGGDEALKTLLSNVKADKLPGQIYFSCDKATGVLIPKGQVERL